MQFLLGTHRPSWLGRTEVPLFVSRRTLAGRKTLPKALGPWALDSGGFTEVAQFGGWRMTPREYAEEVAVYDALIGRMEWAAPQDWMCEPWVIERTGLSVEEHQWRTVDNFLALRAIAPELPFVPVLQGWTLRDYVVHAQMYAGNGVELEREPLVGIGSVCRRQQTQGGREVVEHFARAGLRLHAFGLKTQGLREVGYLLASSDSMAWSYDARRTCHRTGQPMLDACSHRSCANCMAYALVWRDRVLGRLGTQQPSLFA